jgi:hypothetical protein
METHIFIYEICSRYRINPPKRDEKKQAKGKSKIHIVFPATILGDEKAAGIQWSLSISHNFLTLHVESTLSWHRLGARHSHNGHQPGFTKAFTKFRVFLIGQMLSIENFLIRTHLHLATIQRCFALVRHWVLLTLSIYTLNDSNHSAKLTWEVSYFSFVSPEWYFERICHQRPINCNSVSHSLTCFC